LTASAPDLPEGRPWPGLPPSAEPATTEPERWTTAGEILLALLFNALILAVLFIRLPLPSHQRSVEPHTISVQLVPPPKPPAAQKKPEPSKPQPKQEEPKQQKTPPKPAMYRESGGTDLSLAPGEPPKIEAEKAPKPQMEIEKAPPAPKSEIALPSWARKLARGYDLPKGARVTRSATSSSSGNRARSNHPGEGGGDPYLDAMLDQIVSHLTYPPEAGGASGVAIYGLAVARSGRLVSLTLLRSSGIRALDFAAEDAIRSSAPFRPLPPDYEDPVPITATIPVRP